MHEFFGCNGWAPPTAPTPAAPDSARALLEVMARREPWLGHLMSEPMPGQAMTPPEVPTAPLHPPEPRWRP